MSKLKKIKQQLRQEIRHKRIEYHRGIAQGKIDKALIHHFDQLKLPKDRIIAGYMAEGSEINITALLKHLHAQGYTVALPVVPAKEALMLFRQWKPGTPLEQDAERVFVPSAVEPEVTPDVLLLPLIAFDMEGHRLGQGMGYYDAILKKLASEREILAIGMAYSIQQVEQVPISEKDYHLNLVITPEKLMIFSQF